MSFLSTRRRRFGLLLIVGLIVFGLWFRHSRSGASITLQTDTVKRQDVRQTVLATGQVVSGLHVNLSFKTSGVVTRLVAKEGQKVKNRDVLATLSQTHALASLATARGSLAQAEANYQKVLAGASSQDIAVAESAVRAAEVTEKNAEQSLRDTTAQQAVVVRNALTALLNSAFSATPAVGNSSAATPTVSGSYTGTQAGKYTISIYSSSNGWRFATQGLEQVEGAVSVNAPVPLGTRGLYLQFSSGSLSERDSWTVEIPNTQASTYTANANAYQAALQTQKQSVGAGEQVVAAAQAGLAQARAALALKQAEARPSDVAAAKAQIISAQGQVASAYAALEDTMLRAPANGTITQVDIKLGEQATAGKPLMVLQDVGNLHVESFVSEANIADLRPGQTVDYTFDALGSDRHVSGTLLTVNPASTVISGVVNYKVTAEIETITDVKPGMTANMTMLIAEKRGVLTVPTSAIIEENGQKMVRVVDDAKKKLFHTVPVETGLMGDGGLVEIILGLSEGQTIVTYLKTL